MPCEVLPGECLAFDGLGNQHVVPILLLLLLLYNATERHSTLPRLQAQRNRRIAMLIRSTRALSCSLRAAAVTSCLHTHP